jgi:TolB-like protein/Tfp pilus assembly protein PilF
MDAYFQGMAWLNKGWTPEYLERARRFFDRALALDSGNVEAMVGHATVDSVLGGTLYGIDRDARLAEAEARLSKALSLAPEHPLAHAIIGWVQISSNRAARGIAECERALALDRNMALAHGFIGLAKFLMGRCQEVEADINEALRLSPRDANAFVWMSYVGCAKAYMGASDEAVPWFRRGIDINRNFPSSHFWLAAALANLGRLDEARAEVVAGLALDPAFTVSRFRIGAASDHPIFLAQRELFVAGMRKAGVPEGEAEKVNTAPRLSIVVLPFANIGGDPQQEYFVDGVTESLTTDLSRISGSFVIARNTAFTYKGKHIDVKQIGRELNVRYVLEGSVQRGGNRLRVNVQLIDAESGAHLWAERFDKPLADLFDMQDEIVARLANTLGHELVKAEARRSQRLSNPDSVDLTMRGWAILNQPTMLSDMNVVAEALGLFEQALNLDPDNVDALVGAAAAERFNHVNAGKQSTPEQIARIEERLGKAIRLDPTNARAYTVRGMLYVVTKRTREALQAARNAVNLNPNYASAYAQLAQNQMAPEEWSQSIANIDQAIKLSPRDPELGRWHWIKGKTLLYMREYPDAIREGHAAIDNGWVVWSAFLVLAAGYALSGQQKEAEDFAARILDANPSFTIKYLRSRVEDPEVMFEGLRKAGVPEG